MTRAIIRVCRDASRPPLGGGVQSKPLGHVCRLLAGPPTRESVRRAPRAFCFWSYMPRVHKPAIERVLPRVVRLPWSGCWIFTGAVNESGYGIVGKGHRGAGNDRAHRVTYQHFIGPIPDGLFVCHHCDVPACCNPDHLFLGTYLDNAVDCWSKGRGSKPPRNPHVVGEVHPGHKLTAEQVCEMRDLKNSGWTDAALADRYSVSRSTIYHVCNRNRWKHVA